MRDGIEVGSDGGKETLARLVWSFHQAVGLRDTMTAPSQMASAPQRGLSSLRLLLHVRSPAPRFENLDEVRAVIVGGAGAGGRTCMRSTWKYCAGVLTFTTNMLASRSKCRRMYDIMNCSHSR